MSRNEDTVRSIRHRVEESSEIVEKLVETITIKYSRELDTEVSNIKALLDKKDILSDTEIEHLVMRLPVFMYYASGGLESLGVESDMAKAVKLEVYNEKYVLTEGTIKDKQALVENQIINEQLVEVAFVRAYKKMKTKIDMAEHIFSGAKKVLSKRMQDIDLVRVDKYS